ncbi:MAG: hypothetical protein P4L59_20370 [Desulfosporosinus sp.]|nr:hypothetical protein [Desulfosporosinus sp.]
MAVVQTLDAPFPMAPVVRVMLHRIIEKGVATKDEIDINTLEYRLAEEREKSKTTYRTDGRASLEHRMLLRY